jgi:hypothetical protein
MNLNLLEEDLILLEQLALKAPQGKWGAEWSPANKAFEIAPLDEDGAPAWLRELLMTVDTPYHSQEDLMKFIVAARPEVVLELIKMLRWAFARMPVWVPLKDTVGDRNFWRLNLAPSVPHDGKHYTLGCYGPFLPSPDRANANSGHGYVYVRPDGLKAKCGGPGLCQECYNDKVRQQGGPLCGSKTN